MNSIVLLVRSLDAGGTERQLIALAKGFHSVGTRVQVVSFYRGGLLADELAKAGIPHHSIDKVGRWDVIGFAWRLVRQLRKLDARIVYSFLPVPNIVAALIKPLLRRTVIVWGVRSSEMALDAYDWLSRASYRAESLLACVPDLIICNSQAGLRQAARRGFPATRLSVVPNGVDTTVFRFDAEGRRRVRAELGLSPDAIVVGMVARVDPIKGHDTLIRAAPTVLRAYEKARFVCVGSGDLSVKDELSSLVRSLRIEDKFRWLESRTDMASVYSAFDLFCLPSRGEGFANAIAEAMACARPCVVSDVGDSSMIVSECGRVVPPGDHEALALAIIEVLSGDLQATNKRCRERIEREFGIDRLVTLTSDALGRAAVS